MKTYAYAATVFAAAASAHSWLGCTDHDNSEIRGWMEGNSTFTPPVIIDPIMPWFSYLCKGWPRAKQNPGDWIAESSNYAWNLAANKWNGDNNACHPSQRGPNYEGNAPMAVSRPGGTIRLQYGGNGHSRGGNMPNGDPGVVAVYWKGEPEKEIVDTSEFIDQNKLAEAGFSADSFAYPPGVTKPEEGLVDKGNWMTVKLPDAIIPGRHMMVWVWSYGGAPQWSTCFDVQVQ